jgi:hypothetical protein
MKNRTKAKHRIGVQVVEMVMRRRVVMTTAESIEAAKTIALKEVQLDSARVSSAVNEPWENMGTFVECVYVREHADIDDLDYQPDEELVVPVDGFSKKHIRNMAPDYLYGLLRAEMTTGIGDIVLLQAESMESRNLANCVDDWQACLDDVSDGAWVQFETDLINFYEGLNPEPGEGDASPLRIPKPIKKPTHSGGESMH